MQRPWDAGAEHGSACSFHTRIPPASPAPLGYVPGGHSLIPSAAVREVVNHRPVPRPRLPVSNCVHTACGGHSACHLQRRYPGPGETCRIRLVFPVPPTTSAPGQSVLFDHSSRRDCSLQTQLLAESDFLRLYIKIIEKAIFCLCKIFKHLASEKGHYTSKAKCIAQIKGGT